ncbi:hypothetical protein RhiirA5_421204 [Rhizophagus irregularis]|uniref:Uncharacterized protein n=1 Tax=Rhizophagus irregularis TaxID=588596 RepID=A0A2N0PED9_9GLOM|nr:hypothetical protein RhiirA5_421204 [Rhizophagus irregularis]
MNIPPIPLSAINNFIQNNLVNRITININNTQSRNTLHHGKHIGNKLITPLPVTINRREMGFICFLNMLHLTSKSTIEKACGIVTYEIGDKSENKLPLLLIVGWRISIIGKNKWFVFIGCETDPDIPDESSINKYLKENGNKGSDTLEFEEHSMIIDGSISDGNNAQLDICIRSKGLGLLDRIFS